MYSVLHVRFIMHVDNHLARACNAASVPAMNWDDGVHQDRGAGYGPGIP
jgi:hypothetical protein